MRISKRPGSKECIVSDLSWHVLDPFGNKFVGHEKLDELMAEGFRHCVKFKLDGEINVGVSGPIELDAYKGSQFYSLAALVALDKEIQGATTLVFLENPDADDGSGFAIGLVSGNVVLDLSFELPELDQIYSKFDEICSRVNREFVLSGDIAPMGRHPERHCTLNQLVGKKTAKKIAFADLKSERGLVYFAIAVGAILLLVVANYAWGYYKKSEQDLLRRMEEMKKTPEYVYGEASKKYLEADYAIAAQSATTIAETIGSLPSTLSGWELRELKCNTDSCLSNWTSNGGTYEAFQKAAPQDWKGFRYAQGDKDALGDLKTIYCEIPITLQKAKLPAKVGWPNSNDFAYEMGKLWQSKAKEGYTGSLKGAELLAVPPGLMATTLSIVPTAVFGMPWEVRDQDWGVSKALLKEYPDNVTISDYSIRLDSTNKKVTFSANGVGYVHK